MTVSCALSTVDVSSAAKMIMLFFINIMFYYWMITCALPMPSSVTARKVYTPAGSCRMSIANAGPSA